MQRLNQTKANASRIELSLLFSILMIGSTGFLISFTNEDNSLFEAGKTNIGQPEKESFLTKEEETEVSKWNIFELHEYEITSDTEIIITPKAALRIYDKKTIGVFFKKAMGYEIIFKSKKLHKIELKEYISMER